MLRWLASYRKIHRWIAPTKAHRNVVFHFSFHPNKYYNYMITGVSIGIAAVTVSSNANEDNSIVVSASGIVRFIR